MKPSGEHNRTSRCCFDSIRGKAVVTSKAVAKWGSALEGLWVRNMVSEAQDSFQANAFVTHFLLFYVT